MIDLTEIQRRLDEQLARARSTGRRLVRSRQVRRDIAVGIIVTALMAVATVITASNVMFAG